MIEISNLHKRFGAKSVLRGVTLRIETGETMVIIGRSGGGKSVILKHVIGLIAPDEGEVKIDGAVISKMTKAQLYSVRKNFGMLFQGAALFDSMTVGENVGIALRENLGLAEAEIKKIVAEKLTLVGLAHTEALKPSELSGGMRKRVGLARALATNPHYIFYDEPTTGLDPIMSDSIDSLVVSMARELKVTSVVVTHDMQSVYKVADRVAMLHDGCIYFLGTPEELRRSTDSVIRNFVDRHADREVENEMQSLRQQETSPRPSPE